MNKLFPILLLTLSSAVSCFAQNIDIKSSDKHIHYMGRVDSKPDSTMLSWSGNSVKINFSGSEVKALLKDEGGQNFYNIIVDGQVVQKINPSNQKQWYTLAKGLKPGRHSLELFKLSEWAFGKTWFYGFNLEKGAQILPASPGKARKIEFYGNSITCGFGNLDTTKLDRGTPPFEDNYQSYAAITARHFNAEYSCIARSGIGIMVSWFPLIMPEMYNRLDANDSTSRWDFSKYTPDVVVVNLFQNDSWIVLKPENEQFKARFGTQAPTPEFIIKSYQNFISTIRSKYPNAQIICALGSMDATRAGSAWPGYVQQAVKNLQDKNIHSLMFPFKNTGGHPSLKEHKAMSEQLISFISKNIKW
ncbi:SGNH/GDSL hydrolase family protein [Mucilaginibacter aquatilis]|uniref:Electron transporter RnfD n=1 Tax=Mucilaginibacter aquatilis TaxID=1517760 RepID=A0A6I4ID38_9SPHI|nr:SGNH/GDSL hydrolase family protein [Mucilaginibacter aquatilis]MVN93111.1 electron transporter RnfD [Mucilaginibacter aquatilis]